jgi:hypothetical protein
LLFVIFFISMVRWTQYRIRFCDDYYWWVYELLMIAISQYLQHVQCCCSSLLRFKERGWGGFSFGLHEGLF